MPDSGRQRSHTQRDQVGRGSRASGAALSYGTVLARVVHQLVEVGVGAGISREALMRTAGVTGRDLQDSDARLPVAAEIALWQALAEQIDDPGFGVRAGARFSVQAMGLLGYVASFSRTLGDAVRRVQRYGRIFTAAVEISLDEGLPEVVLAMEQPASAPGGALAQDYRLAATLKVVRDLSGVDIMPAEVGFTHGEPSSTVEHRRHFRSPLRFRAARASILLRPSDLDIPMPKADTTLAGYLGDYAERVLASLVEGETTSQAVRAAIWSLLGDGKPSLKATAAELHLSPRTLQRRLEEEGTSLSQEIERVRETMAKATLSDRSIAIEDVAFLLGYSEASAFYRAFKRWTGTTPSRFRAQAA